MTKYKHLFFDLDHTLWDFDKNSAATLQYLYDEFQLSEKNIRPFDKFREQYEYHNDKLWDRYRKGYIRREELRWKRMWLTMLDFRIGDEKLAKEMSAVYLERLPNQSLLLPYAKEVLEYCKDKNYRMHLITNGFETTQWQKMRSSGLGSYFEEVITSENSKSLKPHADIFHYAMNLTNATVEESLMIGDSLEVDVLGAKQVGIDQVYFNPKRNTHQERVTYEISCLSELIELL